MNQMAAKNFVMAHSTDPIGVEEREEEFYRRIQQLQEAMQPVIKDLCGQEALSYRLEAALSASNHKLLLEEEEVLSSRESRIMKSLADSHSEYQKALVKLREEKCSLIEAYVNGIKNLELISSSRDAVQKQFLEIAKNQSGISKRYDSGKDEAFVTPRSDFKEETAEASIEPTRSDDVPRRPKLSDFGFSEETRHLLEKRPNISSVSGGFSRPAGSLFTVGNPFETGNPFVTVTPGLFGGSFAKTPAGILPGVSDSIQKFRQEIANELETDGSRSHPPLSEHKMDSNPGLSERKGDDTQRTLKHSKGSLDGSLIVHGSPHSPMVPFEGKIPIDFNINTEETQTTNFVRQTESMKSQDPAAAFLSLSKPKLPRLCATDVYNAGRPRNGDEMVGCVNQVPKKPASPHLVSKEVGVLKRPEMPKLCATDLYDVTRITSENPKIVGGAAFKPVSAKKSQKEVRFLPDAAENCNTAVETPVSSDETFTVITDRSVLSASACVNSASANRIKPFSKQDYQALEPIIRQGISLESLNSAVEYLNEFMSSKHGLKTLSPKDLQEIVSSRLDKYQSALFTSALSNSHKLKYHQW